MSGKLVKRVLLTGGFGFIGNHILAHYHRTTFKVVYGDSYIKMQLFIKINSGFKWILEVNNGY